MRWRLLIILVKGFARAIAPSLHAEENHATPVRQERSGLPGNLARDVEVKVAQPSAIGVDDGGATLRSEKEPSAQSRAYRGRTGTPATGQRKDRCGGDT
jgi:hypothetical protein